MQVYFEKINLDVVRCATSEKDTILNMRGEIKMEKFIGKYVIVRGDRSGVFAGILKEKKGCEVVLTNCRRLWYWDGAASLSQLSTDGVSKPMNCKFTVIVDEIGILDAIEIIPCTGKAETNIGGVDIWSA